MSAADADADANANADADADAVSDLVAMPQMATPGEAEAAVGGFIGVPAPLLPLPVSLAVERAFLLRASVGHRSNTDRHGKPPSPTPSPSPIADSGEFDGSASPATPARGKSGRRGTEPAGTATILHGGRTTSKHVVRAQ